MSVKNGFFRNFLLPRGLADAGTHVRLKVAESRKEKLVMKKEQILESAKDVLAKLKGLSVTIKGKVSDKGKLYGGISEADVIAAVEKATKVKLEKDFVKMEHFKDLGEHKAIIHLGPDLEEVVKVVVEAA